MTSFGSEERGHLQINKPEEQITVCIYIKREEGEVGETTTGMQRCLYIRSVGFYIFVCGIR